jgi:hypothetical protein
MEMAMSLTPNEASVEAMRRVLAERFRQVNGEGWTTQHDDQYTEYQLARAAASYAMQSGLPDFVRDAHRKGHVAPPNVWPWEPEWWKPGKDNSIASKLRELEKAGALIIAQMEQLLRN